MLFSLNHVFMARFDPLIHETTFHWSTMCCMAKLYAFRFAILNIGEYVLSPFKYCTRCLSSPNICYKIFDMLTRADLELTQVSAILLVSAIHAIQRKQCVYIVQSSCPNLTQAWSGRESDASVSKRNIRDTAKNHECNS